MNESADGPPAVAFVTSCPGSGTLPVSAAHSPLTCASPVLEPGGQLMPESSNRLSACAASSLVALPAAASPACVSAPVAAGKNFDRTTPLTVEMKKANT